jgi:TfoX/Sxy family transcriptional regulator of competence genes
VAGEKGLTVTVHDPKVLKSRFEHLAGELSFSVTCRPMMGGFIGYADGRTFVSISTGGLGLKLLPADQERALARPGAARMRHSPEQPESKSYITFSKADTTNDDFMIQWLVLAGETAPAKGKR